MEHITITCLSDNKSLYDVTDSLTLTTDRLPRVKIATIRQLCEQKQVGLKWVEEKYQLSDCLTKKGASPTGRVEDKTLSTLIMTEYGQAQLQSLLT